MKKHTRNTSAFTLIELLMVIAIIGILAGILIPTVGAVKKQANKAASKAQLTSYVNAMQLFKGEYGYFPLVPARATGDSYEINLNSKSIDFIKTLSARDPDANNASVSFGGNRRQVAFYSFSESEFWDDNGDISTTQLADRFNNKQIFIVVDSDGNGMISPSGPDGGEGTIRSSVSAYVGEDQDPDGSDNPTYKLWD